MLKVNLKNAQVKYTKRTEEGSKKGLYVICGNMMRTYENGLF